MRKLRLLSTITLFSGILTAFQVPNRTTDRKPIEPLGTTRSQILDLRAGETVIVSAEPGPAGTPEFDTYIYSEQKVLLARDSPDVVSANFEWTTSTAQRVYVLARNTGNRAGTLLVQVRATSPEAGPVSGARSAQPDNAVVNVYYATNRVPAPPSSEFYGTEPDSQIHYGLCHVSIPRGHKMGELEGPSIWKLEFSPNPEKHVMLTGPPISASEQEFFSTLKKNFGGSPRKQALVFLHGFNTTFTGAALRTAQIAYDLGFDGAAIFYSWPSHGDLSPLGYNADVRNADLTVAELKQFLVGLSERSGVQTVHLIAHSMGGRIMTQALSQLGTAPALPRFKRVILMAPDIDAALFRQLAALMETRADEITLYASSRDLALKASNLYSGYPRAGQGGKNILLVSGITTIDASVADTSLLGALHQYYADSRTILSDLFQLMQGRQAAERFGLRKSQRNGLPYWIFRP
jgi:esterase/lipase superfamily enzyme